MEKLISTINQPNTHSLKNANSAGGGYFTLYFEVIWHHKCDLVTNEQPFSIPVLKMFSIPVGCMQSA